MCGFVGLDSNDVLTLQCVYQSYQHPIHHHQVGLQNIDAHTCCGVGIGHHAAESANTRAMEWLARDLPAMNTRFNDEAAAATILTAHAKRWPGMLPLHVAASLGQKEHVQLLLTSPALGPLEGRARLLGVKDNYDYTVLEGAACRYKPFVVMGLYLWRVGCGVLMSCRVMS